MAYVNVELSASTVVEAMNERGEFLADMWVEIAEGIQLGGLLDNTMDAVHSMDPEVVRRVSSKLKELAGYMDEYVKCCKEDR